MTNQDILILLDSIKFSIREGRIDLALEKIGVLQDKLEQTKEEQMDELDFLIDDEYETEEWFCDDCNMGPIAAEKTKCPRCGFKLKYHHDEHQEMDENGDVIDMEEYHKHYQMTFRKNTFNKSPRRIHRNIGGRKKGTLPTKREMVDILKGKKKRNNITWSLGGENDYFQITMDMEGEFCVIATWSPRDPERYCQCHIPSGSYSKTMALVEKIYSDGWEDMGRPDAIKIEKI